MDKKTEALLYTLRQCVIMFLCALEDYLDVKERAVIPKHERRKAA